MSQCRLPQLLFVDDVVAVERDQRGRITVDAMMRSRSHPQVWALGTVRRFFSNVGGRASIPPLPGLDQVSYFNNSPIMEVDFLPEHLIVVDGRYVAWSLYRRFGSEVTIVERGPRLIQREDEDVSEAIGTILESEGINIRLSAECIALEKRGHMVVVNVDCKKRR